MALIAREELQIECRTAGHDVVVEVLSAGPNISDDRMDELFEPLVSSIEERTRDAVEREIDEYRGQREERDEEAARQEIIDQRKAELEENFQVYLRVDPALNTSRADIESESDSVDSDSEREWDWDSSWEYVPGVSWVSRLPSKNTDHISVRKIRPRYDVDDLSDEDIMEQSYDADDYATTYLVNVADIHTKNVLLYNLRSDTEAFATYVKENHILPQCMLQYVERLREAGCELTYRTDMLIEIINMFMPSFARAITDILGQTRNKRRTRSTACKRS